MKRKYLIAAFVVVLLAVVSTSLLAVHVIDYPSACRRGTVHIDFRAVRGHVYIGALPVTSMTVEFETYTRYRKHRTELLIRRNKINGRWNNGRVLYLPNTGGRVKVTPKLGFIRGRSFWINVRGIR